MKSSGDSLAVQAEGLAFSYGERRALQGVGFGVPKHSVHCFLGPNGSGKSTVFKILATILPMQEGEARILGLDLRHQIAAIRRRIGIVFQSPALDRKLSVRQNLTYGGHLYGLSGDSLSRRIDEMLEHAGLQEWAREKVEHLSGGLKRRVELAKGLLSQPELLLLDEPTTGLDAGARKDLWQFLRGRKDLTVLVSTHLMDEAELTDRIIILHQGKIVAEGQPSVLRRSVGGEVLEVACSEPEVLAAEVHSRFGVESMILDQSLRFQVEEPHLMIAELVKAFGSRFERISLSHPSLEDVYIQKTGHRLSKIPSPA